MMRRAFVTALTALTLLIVPTGALAAKQPANLAPYFNDYLVCFSGHVYTDFVDPDGNDEYMNVAMAVYRPHVGDWTYVWMTNTGRTTHGVFWWTKLSDHGIDPAHVTWYAFSATDQDGVWSGWTYADSRCTVQSPTAASLDDRITAPDRLAG